MKRQVLQGYTKLIEENEAGSFPDREASCIGVGCSSQFELMRRSKWCGVKKK
ncbi:hypothetical protein [Bacillus benzoevorans]